MISLQIEGRVYKEITSVMNKLQFFAPGNSLLEVHFDINGVPSLKATDGSAYWVGIPEQDEKELLRIVKEKYPNGFHSRNDSSIEWLKARLKELADSKSVKIKLVDEYGCLMVDGESVDAYKVELEDESISSIYIAMTERKERFVVFRPYIQLEEFGEAENVYRFYPETGTGNLSDDESTYIFKDEIVSYKEYIYKYDSNILKGTSYGFKNNDYGFMKESNFGNFMGAGGCKFF